MDASVLVAIVSGVIALVSVIVSAIFARAGAKRAAAAQRELEVLKHTFDLNLEGHKAKLNAELESLKRSLEGSQQAMELKRDVVEENARILGRACSFIQQFKDAVREAVVSDQSADLCDRLKSLDNELFVLYQNSHYRLIPLERKVLHDVKTFSSRVARDCDRIHSVAPAREIDSYLTPLTNAHEVLIREYEKWTGLLVDNPHVATFDLGVDSVGQTNFLFRPIHDAPPELE